MRHRNAGFKLGRNTSHRSALLRNLTTSVIEEASQALAARTRNARTVAEACQIAAAVLSENSADLPVALIYLVAPDGEHALLEGASHATPGSPAVPRLAPLAGGGSPWPLGDVIQSRQPR